MQDADCSFPRKERLNKNKDFQRIKNEGKKGRNKFFTLYFLENKKLFCRVGFAISKRLGNAVSRNKLKRKLVETYRLNKTLFIKGYDILIIPQKPCLDLPFNNLVTEWKNICLKINILRNE